MWRGRDGRPKRVVMRFDGGAGSVWTEVLGVAA